MRNFLKIAQGLNTMNLLLEMQRQPELWNQNPERLLPNGPHRETSDIWLRYKDKRRAKADLSDFNDEHYGVWYPAYYALPTAGQMIHNLMAAVQGEAIGGVLIYKIPGRKRIYPHTDTGWHVEYFEKFNVYLQSEPSNVFHYPASGEKLRAVTGDVFWFRNDVEHEVINDGQEDHIVMTVCIHIDKGGRSCLSP